MAKIESVSEILQVAEVVAREQGLEREAVLSALEKALVKPAELKYGSKHDIYVKIDRENGEIAFSRRLRVVSQVSNIYREIQYEDALKLRPGIEIGDYIEEHLPPIEFDRVSAALSRQVMGEILKNTRQAQHYREYKDRVGEMFNVMIKRNEITYLLAEFGNKVEGVFLKDDLIPRENLQIGERVKAVIKEVRPESVGSIIRLSRTSPYLLMNLMKDAVTEIEEGIIEIKGCARDPGSRAKLAVYSPDTGIDAVGACIGPRGSRIQSVSAELCGEKIDVIEWSSDPAKYIINALAPAEITKVIIDEQKDMIEVVVPDDQLSLAIGRRGQNVKLASQLTKWQISIITEEKESKRYNTMIEDACRLFMDHLHVDELLGRLLATEGFLTIEDIADSDVSELSSLEGFDHDLAVELQMRAREQLDKKEKDILNYLKKEQVEQQFLNFNQLSLSQKQALVENHIKSLRDLADLSRDELIDILGGEQISPEEADAVIMQLRRSVNER